MPRTNEISPALAAEIKECVGGVVDLLQSNLGKAASELKSEFQKVQWNSALYNLLKSHASETQSGFYGSHRSSENAEKSAIESIYHAFKDASWKRVVGLSYVRKADFFIEVSFNCEMILKELVHNYRLFSNESTVKKILDAYEFSLLPKISSLRERVIAECGFSAEEVRALQDSAVEQGTKGVEHLTAIDPDEWNAALGAQP